MFVTTTHLDLSRRARHEKSPAVLALGLVALAWACDGSEPTSGRASRASEIYGIDLTVSAISGPPSAQPWSSFEVQVTACNQGGYPSQGAELSVLLSDDGTIDGSEPQLGSEWIEPMAPGECRTLAVLSHVNAPGGIYTLGAIVDHWNSVEEIDESNNAMAGAALAVGHDPDLLITSLEGPPSARPWDQIAARVTVCNQGQSGSYGGDVELFLSDDEHITTDDMHLAHVALPGLQPGQCNDLTMTGHAGGPDGAYYLGAIVDPYDSIGELIEDNNVLTAGLMGLGLGPDVVITALTGPAGVEPWSQVDVTLVMCNQGTTAAEHGNIDFFLSGDDLITPDDEHAGGTHIPRLEPGHCSSRPAHFYNHADSGSFTLGAIATLYGGDPELIASNNVKAGDVVAVGNAPDLVVIEVTGPRSVQPWDELEVEVTVCNRGTADSHGVDVALYTSPDDAITTADRYAGNLYLPELRVGQCASAPVMGWIDDPGSAAYVGAVVDPHDHEFELVETNNATAGGLFGVGFGPDLAVTELSGPAVATVGQEITTSLTVCNHGTGMATGVAVELYFSTDDVIGGGDHHAGNVWFSQLDPGECVTALVESWPNVPVGSAYLGAIVDPYDNAPELIESNNTTLGGTITFAP